MSKSPPSTKKKTGRPPSAMEKLDQLGIDWYCGKIIGGTTNLDAAKQAGVSRDTLVNWVATDPERIRRAQDARTLSSFAFDELAEKLITGAKNPFGLQKARELAHHYRWRASKIAPNQYGNRQELVGPGGTPLIPDPYQDMTKEAWELECARRMAFVLQRGAVAADTLAKGSASST